MACIVFSLSETSYVGQAYAHIMLPQTTETKCRSVLIYFTSMMWLNHSAADIVEQLHYVCVCVCVCVCVGVSRSASSVWH